MADSVDSVLADIAKGLKGAMSKTRVVVAEASDQRAAPLSDEILPGPAMREKGKGLIHPRVFRTEKEARARDMSTEGGLQLSQLEADIMNIFEEL